MLGTRYIIYVGIIAGLCVSTAAHARPLSKAERVICPKLKSCVDILRRHDASEFDYSVLETEFQGFGLVGRNALFDILFSDAGNAGVSQMIVSLGPLSDLERRKVEQRWSKETAAKFLPLFMDGKLRSRDKILLTLSDPDPQVRETARQALILLPSAATLQPVPTDIVEPLLQGLAIDPMSVAAPYLAQVAANGREELVSTLLNSQNSDIVGAAYASLHRQNPRQAFDLLLTQMKQIETAKQARVIGDVLVKRHAERSDGFYLKFAGEISTDKTFPIPARAVGLHAVFKIQGEKRPTLLAQPSEPFAFLIRGESQATQDIYLPVSKAAKLDNALSFIWKTATEEKWGNRDQVSEAFKDTRLKFRVIEDLIRSDDLHSVRVGLSKAGLAHKASISSQVNHPVKSIALAARQALELKKEDKNPREICRVSQFDLTDMLEQMPYFESAWFETNAKSRVNADRQNLVTAHPTAQGWLAGYDLGRGRSEAAYLEGSLIQFDNKTGGFNLIDGFLSPIAILPNRRLRLGETTSRFWLLDRFQDETKGIAAYQLNLGSKTQLARRVAILPPDAKAFSVAQNGDLLVTFDTSKPTTPQPPLRYTSSGRVSLACVPPTPSRASPSTLN